MSDALITRNESSRRTGLSLVTIDRLVRTGALPAVRYGRRVCIPERAVTDYINNAARPATQRRAADAVEQRIAELLAAAPPLTAEQRSRLKSLLNVPAQASGNGATA